MHYPTHQIAEEIAVATTGSGPATLFIHGVPATHTLWRPVVERVADRRRCIAPDLPGFGGSASLSAPLSIADRARSILTAIDRLGVEEFDLVGHSYGGAVALTLAAKSPERVRSLALLTPLTPALPPLARLTAYTRIVRGVSRLWRLAPGAVRRTFIASIWTRVNYGAAWQPERAREVAREADIPTMIETLGRAMTHANFDEYAAALDTVAEAAIPTLLLSCGRDRVVPCAQQQRLLEQLPAARHQHFPNGTHLPMWQHPDAVAAMLLEHWAAAGGP